MAMTPVPPGRTLRDLRQLTPARVGLGRAGAGLPTDALLAFTLDHARARDAVHAAFDARALMQGLEALGLEPLDYGDPTLVGWWNFTEGTGTVAYDYSGDNATGAGAGPRRVRTAITLRER